jgi:hypothetical protein
MTHRLWHCVAYVDLATLRHANGLCGLKDGVQFPSNVFVNFFSSGMFLWKNILDLTHEGIKKYNINTKDSFPLELENNLFIPAHERHIGN